ncbi:hypothetical protein B0181_05010 [Moraxella caviae]|uniref:Domain of uncharacterized function (DUF1983) n=1 Tax=Moraxella caviae TaxID=34060 RepID=A0A1T0A3D5_9GAMM|nr:phage tail protein [Moraxella caviae]OOR90234.1 hypothetical protein B0181_05010 [Moraxella caviae]STZ14545.1 Domain of uncharacterised function (DUF1983) [Moraxella caviae]VEW12550.1 Domain of uncharacterised function (DUF1983) [Moraxella caviae]
MITGFKKGQSNQRQPNIQKDSVQSLQTVKILYGLAEGEIYGLANGASSIRLENTPIVTNGVSNFNALRYEFRAGTNDQAHITGFDSVVNEIGVGVELRHDKPFIRAFNDKQLSAVAVRLKWDRLAKQETNGDVGGYRIDYAIDVRTDNGAFIEVLRTFIQDKTSAGYTRSHRINLPKARTGWQIRVRRLTANSTSDLISDTMYIDAVQELFDSKMRYPCTALLALEYDAKSFQNIAKLSVRLKGKIIRVPSNYNAQTRTYTGLWDGTFIESYSNNPAWVLYDLLLAKRYGLGSRLDASMVDKWALYEIGKYCDELVDDGNGNKEPRFAINVYLQKAEDAFNVISQLAGVFRGLSYWNGQAITVNCDMPKDPVYTFSRANVVDGLFVYTGTRARDRHSVVKVAWDNPDNDYQTEYEWVKDEAAIARIGIRQLDLSAFGCTSLAQARRAGQWALLTEQLETKQVSFKTGLEGFIPQVGDVINISDEVFAGRANGGRIAGVNQNRRTITLDRAVTAKRGDVLVVNTASGIAKRSLVRDYQNESVVAVDAAFETVSTGNVWAIDSSQLRLMQFRVMSITKDGDTFNITGVQYEPAKFGATVKVAPKPHTVNESYHIASPEFVTLSQSIATHQGQSVTTLNIAWGQVQMASHYIVEWRKDGGNWIVLPKQTGVSADISGVYGGNYEAKVTAISPFGVSSQPVYSQLTTITGKVGKPNRPARLTAKGLLFGMQIDWAFGAKSDDTNYTEIQVSPDGRSNITTLGTFAYPTNKHEITGLQGNLTQFYRGRIVDKLGNTSDWTAWTSGTTEAQAEKVLELLTGQITTSQLHQDLTAPINKIGGLETGLASARFDINKAISDIGTERNRISQAIADIGVLRLSDNAKTAEIANLKQTVGGHTGSIRDLAVTTGELSQRYTQLKTASDNANSEITAIKQTQSGQATQLDTLSSRFDSLAVGGRNLLKHTEHLDQLWRFASGRRGSSMVIADGVARLTSNDTSWKHFGYDISKATAEAWLKDGTTFTLSVYAKKISGNPRLSVAMRKGITGGFKDDLVGKSFDLSNDWQKLVVTGTITAEDLQYLFVRFEFWVGGIIELKKPKLEYGNIATDWTPAPEDTDSAISAVQSNLTTNYYTKAEADKAISQKATQATTTIGGKTMTVEQRLASLNGITGEYTVKMNANGAATGFGLAMQGQKSEFMVQADRFSLWANGGKTSPFTVLTRAQTINGVSVPAGTYINSAYIQNGSIDVAKINKASIKELSALSANIGTLRTSDSRGTFTYTGSKIELRDPRGRLLLEMGLL